MRFSNDIVCRILDYIDNNFNGQISICEIAYRFSYDKYYLMKLFKREIGISIIEYLHRMRVYKSMIMIQSTDYSFTRIALVNGFSSLEYFSEVFHKIMGISAREYRFYIEKRYLKDNSKIDSILFNWAKLDEFFIKIIKYKKNRKPANAPVLKRTIFL